MRIKFMKNNLFGYAYLVYQASLFRLYEHHVDQLQTTELYALELTQNNGLQVIVDPSIDAASYIGNVVSHSEGASRYRVIQSAWNFMKRSVLLVRNSDAFNRLPMACACN